MKHLTKADIVGIIPPVVTPFTENGDVDQNSFVSELHFTVRSAVSGIAVGGSTGEGQLLYAEELAALVRLARAELPGSLPVIAGISTTHTRDAVRRSLLAAEAGAEALMVTPPIFGTHSTEGLVSFYADLWEAAGLPIILYNVIVGNPLTPTVTARLCDIPGIIGIKESTAGNLDTLDLLLRNVSDRISVMWGLDELMVPACAFGAAGSIAALNAVLPDHSVRALEAVHAGDLGTAVQLQHEMTGVVRAFVGPNKMAQVKAAINLQGRSGGYARRPYVPVGPEIERRLRESLEAAGCALAVARS